MKKFALAAAAALLAAGSAHAGFVTIDDFSVDQSVSDVAPGNGAVVSIGPVRTMSSNMLTGVAPISNNVEVTAGILSIVNGGGDDSEVKISWNLGAFTFPADAFNFQFSAMVLQSDGNPTSVVFDLGGVELLSNSIPGNTIGLPVGFGINPALIAGGGVLTMTLNGAPGWDLDMDTFGISFDQPASNVPEPGSLALVGLALAAAAGVARRRQA